MIRSIPSFAGRPFYASPNAKNRNATPLQFGMTLRSDVAVLAKNAEVNAALEKIRTARSMTSLCAGIQELWQIPNATISVLPERPERVETPSLKGDEPQDEVFAIGEQILAEADLLDEPEAEAIPKWNSERLDVNALKEVINKQVADLLSDINQPKLLADSVGALFKLPGMSQMGEGNNPMGWNPKNPYGINTNQLKRDINLRIKALFNTVQSPATLYDLLDGLSNLTGMTIVGDSGKPYKTTHWNQDNPYGIKVSEIVKLTNQRIPFILEAAKAKELAMLDSDENGDELASVIGALLFRLDGEQNPYGIHIPDLYQAINTQTLATLDSLQNRLQNGSAGQYKTKAKIIDLARRLQRCNFLFSEEVSDRLARLLPPADAIVITPPA